MADDNKWTDEQLDDLVRGLTPPPSSQKKSGGVEPVFKSFAEIEPEPVEWLWPGRIALGKLTMLVGDPGLGKSLVTATFAAHVSKGFAWPIDASMPPVGDVILLSAEDDPADTIRPRLDAAGADVSRVYILKAIRQKEDGTTTQRSFSLKRDIEALEEVFSSVSECRLLIIDPISAYLDGTDGNSNSDVRGLFTPLVELAERYKVAVVCVSHMNKSGAGNALYRTMGSLAFTAAARAAYLVTKDKENKERRLILGVKNNLAVDGGGLAYTISTAPNGAPMLTWEQGVVETTADEALAQPKEEDTSRTGTDEAIDFLKVLLVDGPMPATEIQKAAEAADISKKPLRTARARLGIQPRKSSFSGGWEWALPSIEDAQGAQDIPPETEGILGQGGHLPA